MSSFSYEVVLRSVIGYLCFFAVRPKSLRGYRLTTSYHIILLMKSSKALYFPKNLHRLVRPEAVFISYFKWSENVPKSRISGSFGQLCPQTHSKALYTINELHLRRKSRVSNIYAILANFEPYDPLRGQFRGPAKYI